MEACRGRLCGSGQLRMLRQMLRVENWTARSNSRALHPRHAAASKTPMLSNFPMIVIVSMAHTSPPSAANRGSANVDEPSTFQCPSSRRISREKWNSRSAARAFDREKPNLHNPVFFVSTVTASSIIHVTSRALVLIKNTPIPREREREREREEGREGERKGATYTRFTCARTCAQLN